MGTPLNKEEMIQKLRDFYEENGRTPVYADFSKGTPNARTYGNYFGSWYTALELAGLLEIKSPKKKTKHISDEELLKDLKDYCNKYNELPSGSSNPMNNFHSYATYRKRFGSMENALNLIGMGYLWGDKDKYSKRWTKDEIINIIIEFCNKNNRIPKNRDFQNVTSGDIPNIKAVLQHWDSWDSVLLDIKNFLPIFSDKVDEYFYKFTDDYMYEKFMQLYNELGRMPLLEEINNCEYMPNYTTYINKFGSLKDFLIKYDLIYLIDGNKRMHSHNYTNEYLLNKLLEYINKNNKIPHVKDLINDSNMPAMETYIKRFGSYYYKALDLLGLKEQFISDNPNSLYNLFKLSSDLDECPYTANSSTYWGIFK